MNNQFELKPEHLFRDAKPRDSYKNFEPGDLREFNNLYAQYDPRKDSTVDLARAAEESEEKRETEDDMLTPEGVYAEGTNGALAAAEYNNAPKMEGDGNTGNDPDHALNLLAGNDEAAGKNGSYGTSNNGEVCFISEIVFL